MLNGYLYWPNSLSKNFCHQNLTSFLLITWPLLVPFSIKKALVARMSSSLLITCLSNNMCLSHSLSHSLPLLPEYELLFANCMQFTGPILYQKTLLQHMSSFLLISCSSLTPFAAEKTLLPPYEPFPANYLPVTYPIPYQKGFVTSYEFFHANYMRCIAPILHQKSFVTP